MRREAPPIRMGAIPGIGPGLTSYCSTSTMDPNTAPLGFFILVMKLLRGFFWSLFLPGSLPSWESAHASHVEAQMRQLGELLQMLFHPSRPG